MLQTNVPLRLLTANPKSEAEGIVVLVVRANRMNQAPSRQSPQSAIEAGELVRGRQVHRGPSGKFPADNGATLEQGALVGLQAVEPAREQRLDRGRDGLERFGPSLLEEGEELFDEEGISLGERGNPLLRRSADLCAPELTHEQGDRSLLERLEP